MVPASPGEPSQPAAPNSAPPRSRLSRQILASVEEQYPSAQLREPTTAEESLFLPPLSDKVASSDLADLDSPEQNLHRDAQRMSPLTRTRWLIGSLPSAEDLSESTILPSSRRTPSPESRSAGRATRLGTRNNQEVPTASLTSASMIFPSNEEALQSPLSPPDLSTLTDSVESIAAKLMVSPQTIPESRQVDHSLSPVASSIEDMYDPLSRNSSTRSIRMRPQRIPGAASRRSSRRSNSAQTSVSPAHAFLANWGKGDVEENATESKPDDEGQSIGLNNEYIIGRTLNRGGFGVVKEVHSIDEHGNRTVRAVKIVRKSITGVGEAENEKAQQEVEHEVSIWRYLQHRHILSLHAVYETDFATFCVMDLNTGGTLFDLVRKSRQNASSSDGRKGLAPKLAKSYAYQLACALRYLHEDIRVCHRDVKLENCLIDMSVPNAESDGGVLRLCDFGLADFLHSESMDEGAVTERDMEYLSLSGELPKRTASSIIGTLEYASPKGLSVNRKLFETAGDVWAFGVIVYALCTGDLPFRHPMPSKTAELILHAEWDEYALRHAAAGGAEVIDLVKGCLERDIDLRFTISEALRSEWFEGCREMCEEDCARGLWAS
ncbi:uncharacterized protein MYCFIDRAFT_163010 [Pseudocercospora fijiensis CIRAD86]|uniref:Protein kinase domain-containing protein n=1 Tax=Pseudocercospora fijiensis (strain CIRAD86) TaxID=383855 RepID=M2Z2U7_PSEFD|nr:uncharacterized protein MYCFIDRAFT_163010 [Pseudocercospora fijiensis CIRAD86]EME84170.1 hypothetical protein MYCFIDRAFT_163010 [Pseudocercospora fijiensis CIRAD86]